MGTNHEVVKCNCFPHRVVVAAHDVCQITNEWRDIATEDSLFVNDSTCEAFFPVWIVPIPLMVIAADNKESSPFIFVTYPRKPSEPWYLFEG